jgi:hypothetical protein
MPFSCSSESRTRVLTDTLGECHTGTDRSSHFVENGRLDMLELPLWGISRDRLLLDFVAKEPIDLALYCPFPLALEPYCRSA